MAKWKLKLGLHLCPAWHNPQCKSTSAQHPPAQIAQPGPLPVGCLPSGLVKRFICLEFNYSRAACPEHCSRGTLCCISGNADAVGTALPEMGANWRGMFRGLWAWGEQTGWGTE